ncbi:DUF5985 family protein [Ramlibacter algicola]|uniref:Uncharacterized protein n=1 Tax=Ramlibacter algicola TaxID=2795217 RepID=A0A934URS3_9BURK|nr:DUF5985 family protein [Ramlibacter algicola]MBK0393490.1 hypothetical protein [Ramlibacter algicola]
MAPLIYALCAITSALCTVLLWRGYVSNKVRLLFWAASSFALLTVNNILLLADKVVWAVEVDLRMWRLGVGLAAVLLLLFGLIWEED